MDAPLILCYHAVSRDWPAPLAVKPEDLSDHVELLVRRGYRGVTFHEAVTSAPRPRTVAITFDDAFRSVIEQALPILGAAGLPATVFAPTGFVGTEVRMGWPGVDQWLSGAHRDELLPLSWKELQALADIGWEIGSHTRSHPRLTELEEPSLAAELRGSREMIEARIGVACRSLAYPFGAHDERVVAAADRAGYEVAGGTAVAQVEAGERLARPRIVINRVDRLQRFRLKISPAACRIRAAPPWGGLVAARRGVRRRLPWADEHPGAT